MEDKSVVERTSTTPFERWEDWVGDGKVVTFHTITDQLYSKYELAAIDFEDGEREVNHEEFDASKVPEPGVYSDDGYDDCYTIVLPYDFMVYELCQEYIEKLNKKFDENIHLKKPEKEEKEG